MSVPHSSFAGNMLTGPEVLEPTLETFQDLDGGVFDEKTYQHLVSERLVWDISGE